MNEQANVFTLLPPEEAKKSVDLEKNPEFIKQGTKEWHEQRRKSMVTASTIHNALGLRSLNEQKLHLYTQVKKRPCQPLSEETKRRMEHGKKMKLMPLQLLLVLYYRH